MIPKIRKTIYFMLFISIIALLVSLLVITTAAGLSKAKIVEDFAYIPLWCMFTFLGTLFTLLIETFIEAAIDDHYSKKITIGKVIRIKEVNEAYFAGNENKSETTLGIPVESYTPNRLKGFETVNRTISV